MPDPQPLPADLSAALPIGFATKVGSTVTSIAYVLSLYQGLDAGNVTQGTITTTIVGTVALGIVLWGRFHQAAALLKRS